MLPKTTASTCARVMPASVSAATQASRIISCMVTSSRRETCLVWPVPITATALPTYPTSSPAPSTITA